MELGSVRGYKKLTEEQKKLFERVFYKHQSGLGIEAKKDFTPVSIKWEKTYLKVVFKNGEWLHYTQTGSWY